MAEVSVEESIRSLWEASRSDDWSVESSASESSAAPVEDTAEGKEISMVFSDLEVTTTAAPRGQRLRVEGFASPMASSALFDGFQLYLSTTKEAEEGEESVHENTSDLENEHSSVAASTTPMPTPTKASTEKSGIGASPRFGTTLTPTNASTPVESPRFATTTPTSATSAKRVPASSPRFEGHPTPIINNRTKSVTWATTPLGRLS